MSTALTILSPEARTLLDGVPIGLDLGRRANSSAGTPLREQSAREEVDWETLYRLLGQERAAAALHPVPDRLGVDPPPDWDERLRALGAIAGFRQRRLLATLEEVVEILSERGIRVCLLKGAALALARYPQPLQRPMADLDLLVDPERLDDAWRAMTGAGWVWDRDRYPGDLYDPRQHGPPLEDPDRRGHFVELHDGLFVDRHPFRFGPDDLQAGARPLGIGDAEALVPGAAPHLVHTCIHFAWSHTLAKAGWRTFRDVAVLADAPGFDWSDFLDRTRRAGAARPCYWTLRLSRRLGGVEIPECVLARLAPSRLPSAVLSALERHFALRLFAGSPGEGGCPSVALSRKLWRIGARPPGPGALPWAHDEGFHGRDGNAEDEGVPVPVARVARHVRDAGEWAQYLRAVLGGRRSSEGRPGG